MASEGTERGAAIYPVTIYLPTLVLYPSTASLRTVTVCHYPQPVNRSRESTETRSLQVYPQLFVVRLLLAAVPDERALDRRDRLKVGASSSTKVVGLRAVVARRRSVLALGVGPSRADFVQLARVEALGRHELGRLPDDHCGPVVAQALGGCCRRRRRLLLVGDALVGAEGGDGGTIVATKRRRLARPEAPAGAVDGGGGGGGWR